MARSRPLAFVDSAALVVLGAALLAAAGWTHYAYTIPGTALVNPDAAVAVALADDTGAIDEDASD